MDTIIGAERLQLLTQWKSLIDRNPDWIASPFRQVDLLHAASHGAPIKGRSLASYIRQLHDKLGFKAKGPLTTGGLCAGTIFRTQAFIDTQYRVGSKLGQSVHVEHTFPVRQIALEIVRHPLPDYVATLVWFLTHSVATAFHENEKVYLRGRSSTSDAL
ncbi:hypothetical protein ACQR1I_36765, partial [Bradyrhizobium sp. HKCCYLS2038]|uniref:hypothetical protein n=1 Tax=unclassified Bradyrhizobium TaxID=2631580 RepID=UPI003EBF6527